MNDGKPLAGALRSLGVEKLGELVNAELKQLQGKTSPEAAAEAEKSKLAMQIAEARARVEQELAIADRIRTAAEVEIDEFLDASGGGGLGVDVAKQSVGLSGSGQKVSRRVVRLKGWK